MSPNGEAPDFKDTPQALAAIWAHVCVIKSSVSALPCKERGKQIEKLKEGSQRTAGQRSMLRMALPYVVPIIAAVGAAFATYKVSTAGGAPPAPPAPHVTTVTGG